MPYKLEEIDGIGSISGIKLREIGIVTTEDLLKRCSEARGRQTTAFASGISEAQLAKWVNMADLMRISGIGQDYADLLAAAGVETVSLLREQIAADLAARLRAVNAKQKLTRSVASENQVGAWIDQAKRLDPIGTA